jgi:predicted 3-demethylubiquinone-9 3-methyltransferase (glyoxalase superfamily)
MKKQITPCLWYDAKAKEAVLDGGPMYHPNPSISFYYICEQTEEFDRIWNAFKEGGNIMMPDGKYPWGERYGWITDKYGVSWQLALGKISDVGQKITPCFLFTGKQYGRAEEAMSYYSTIFKESTIEGILRFDANEQPDEKGKVKHAQMSIDGEKFMFMDSAEHKFSFSEGVSLTVYCETQQEIDYYWEKLTESGAESMCGWLKDKFGVSWQIIPTVLGKILNDPKKAGKAAQAFMSMRKLDIEQIVQASLT